jgi:hypothetical protein
MLLFRYCSVLVLFVFLRGPKVLATLRVVLLRQNKAKMKAKGRMFTDEVQRKLEHELCFQSIDALLFFY